LRIKKETVLIGYRLTQNQVAKLDEVAERGRYGNSRAGVSNHVMVEFLLKQNGDF
jgi:hypothetical protein